MFVCWLSFFKHYREKQVSHLNSIPPQDVSEQWRQNKDFWDQQKLREFITKKSTFAWNAWNMKGRLFQAERNWYQIQALTHIKEWKMTERMRIWMILKWYKLHRAMVTTSCLMCGDRYYTVGKTKCLQELERGIFFKVSFFLEMMNTWLWSSQWLRKYTHTMYPLKEQYKHKTYNSKYSFNSTFVANCVRGSHNMYTVVLCGPWNRRPLHCMHYLSPYSSSQLRSFFWYSEYPDVHSSWHPVSSLS